MLPSAKQAFLQSSKIIQEPTCLGTLPFDTGHSAQMDTLPSQNRNRDLGQRAGVVSGSSGHPRGKGGPACGSGGPFCFLGDTARGPDRLGVCLSTSLYDSFMHQKEQMELDQSPGLAVGRQGLCLCPGGDSSL